MATDCDDLRPSRAGNRTVYGHGRKFTDRGRVDFLVHGTVKNPTVTLRIDRNGRNGQSNPGLADQDHMQSTSSVDIDLPYFTVKKRPGIDPQKRATARHRDRITVPYSVATRLRWPALRPSRTGDVCLNFTQIRKSAQMRTTSPQALKYL
ncbi:hypothetical protein DFH08DRAFT_820761 [Mycena albidolilacea]|uniref:Uncharacterized protein n=1 Tax=Mycena albidolilacea TaxID=1033008 RepID=A0AAD7EET0_9AGAR|nr:hypothetical protein DFH08DRAFT_820761 [Mycena albidolilacea]